MFAVVYCMSNVTSLYETEQLPCDCAPACRYAYVTLDIPLIGLLNSLQSCLAVRYSQNDIPIVSLLVYGAGSM